MKLESDPESIEGLGVDLSDDTPLLFLKPSVGAAADDPPTTLPMEVGATEPTGLSEEVGHEPPTKRLKVNQLEMAHVDEVDVVQSCDLDVSMFEYEIGGDDNDLYVVTTGELADDLLWHPLTEEEPDVEFSLLAQMDALADQFEVKRLLEMGVLIQSTGDEDSSNFGSSLTGKFVRTFRKKERNGQLCWYRRSRLVAREYNYLSIREDTFSPASNAVVTRLIPAMVMSGLYSEDHVIGALDISDAYLQPSILKKNKANGSGCLLLHVDDVLFTMSSDFMHQTFLPILKQAFKLSVTWVDREKGGSFEFLKRLHVLDAGFEKLDIYGETKHVKQCVEMFKKANGGVPAKMYNTPATSHVFAGRDDSKKLKRKCLELTDLWLVASCIYHMKGQMCNILLNVWLLI